MKHVPSILILAAILAGAAGIGYLISQMLVTALTLVAR